MDKWDLRFFELAYNISQWSKDPSTKVGAVFVDNQKRILGVGYNGFPRGIDDSSSRYLNKKTKYAMVVHAEENAILNCLDINKLEGSTCYITPLLPCSNCVSRLLQVGTKCVKILTNDKYLEGRDTTLTKQMLEEAGVDLQVKYGRRN